MFQKAFLIYPRAQFSARVWSRQLQRWHSFPALLLSLGLSALLPGSVVLLPALLALLQGLAALLPKLRSWVVFLAPLALVVAPRPFGAPSDFARVGGPSASTGLIELFRVAVAISKAGRQVTPGAARAATAMTVAGGRADGGVTARMSTAAPATVTASTATPTGRQLGSGDGCYYVYSQYAGRRVQVCSRD